MDFPIREVDHDAGSYPALLREIPHPPQTLYTRGSSIPAENILLCVVGSRKISSYGKAVCEQLIPPLAGYGISIVSGLALGVDATAHALALSAGIHCIAVPGSGIDDSVLYPRANARLGREILTAGGTLISEFEPYFKATEWSFPQRNRIMAGMSHATLLIEAGEKSGTLITARLASDYNRDVLVVPGSIFSHNSSGVHQFLKLGATPITNADDILDVLGIKKNIEQRHQHTYTELEKHILDVLAAPHTFDQLFEHFSVIGMENDLTSTLSLLELNGYIKNSGGVFYKNA